MTKSPLLRAYLLALDASLTPVRDLPFDLRSRISAEPDAHVIHFKAGRERARLITSDLARALRNFDGKRTVFDIIRLEIKNHASPRDITAEQLAIALCTLVEDGILVDPRKGKTWISTLVEGSKIDSYVLRRAVGAGGPIETYFVESLDGTEYFLKIASEISTLAQKESVLKEGQFLAELAGTSTPVLIKRGTFNDRPYLITSKIIGTSLSSLSGLEWLEKVSARERAALGKDLLKAYSAIHRRNILHGDVHNENILVSPDLKSTIIDFGHASPVNADSRRRGGMERFLEPEYYEAITAGQAATTSVLGELYSVAAVLYELIIGSPYLNFELKAGAVAMQIRCSPPTPFRAHGVYGLDYIEKVLLRALSKKPSDRFPNMHEFSIAFGAAAEAQWPTRTVATQTQLPRVSLATTGSIVQGFLSDARAGSILDARDWKQPLCSAHYGAAGIAATLARIAQVRKDPDALALATMWIRRARQWSALPDAYWNDWMTGTAPNGLRWSLLFGELGTIYGDLLIGAAGGPQKSTSRKRLVEAVRKHELPASGELALGSGGWLLTASLLARAGLNQPGAEARVEELDLSAATVSVLASLNLSSWAQAVERAQGCFCGMAHGFIGALYCASVAASRVLGNRLDEAAEIMAGIRVAEAHFSIQQNQRPIYRRLADRDEQWSGWCSGVAGFVQFWTAIYSLTGEERYLEHALNAEHTLRAVNTNNGTLCCGRIGIAYAYLALYRSTRDSNFMNAAETMASDIRGLSLSSLYKGYVGHVHLLADLEDPDTSRMPFVEDCL